MSLGIFQFCLSFLYCKTLYRDLWMYRWRVLDQIIIFIILLEMLFGYHQIKLLVGRYKFWKDGGFRVFIWVFVYHIMGKLHQLFFLFLVFKANKGQIDCIRIIQARSLPADIVCLRQAPRCKLQRYVQILLWLLYPFHLNCNLNHINPTQMILIFAKLHFSDQFRAKALVLDTHC